MHIQSGPEQTALARPCARADRPAKRSVMLWVSRERPTLTELLPHYGVMACWNTKGLASSASKTVWRKFHWSPSSPII